MRLREDLITVREGLKGICVCGMGLGLGPGMGMDMVYYIIIVWVRYGKVGRSICLFFC